MRVVSEADIAQSQPVAGFAPLEVDAVPWAEAPLLELGRRAFFEYPVQITAFAQAGLSNADAPAHYGLWRAEGRLAGLVWTALPRRGRVAVRDVLDVSRDHSRFAAAHG